ncbi:MAG: hypothetical protein ACXWVF_12685, partial [Telluria sp.]
MSNAVIYPKRTSLAVAVAFALSGCGGGGSSPAPVTPPPAPPVTPAPPQTTSLNGVVVDGYISGATIFIDTNNNYIIDAGESSATTDASGRYALTFTGSAADLNGKRLRMTGGTDTSTQQPFTHAMSALVSDVATKPFVPVSPLSTIVDAMVASGAVPGIAQAREALAKVLGLSSAAVFDKDPLAQALAEPTLLQKMIAIQKSVEVLASADRTATETGHAAATGRAASAFGAEVARQAGLMQNSVSLPSIGSLVLGAAANQSKFFTNQAAMQASVAVAADVATLTEATLASSVSQL